MWENQMVRELGNTSSSQQWYVVHVLIVCTTNQMALCSLAEIGAPLLFESRGSRWEALCTLCRRALLEPDMHAHEARHAACLALGALVAAPWAADSAESEASEVEIGGGEGVAGSGADKSPKKKDAQAIVLQRLRDTGLQKQLLAPLGQAAIAEDR